MTDILLIDDNLYFRLGLAENLRRARFNVMVASGGAEGIALAKKNRPEIILCDVSMPAPDGMAVKSALANEAETADIPFIFLSAFSNPIHKSQGLMAGADDYICKPFDFDELIARIQSVLRREDRATLRSKLQTQKLLENLKNSLPTHTSELFRTYLGTLILSIRAARYGLSESDPHLNTALFSGYQLKKMVDDLIWLNEFELDRFATTGQLLDLESSFVLPLKNLHEMWREKNLCLDIKIDAGISIVAPERYFTQAVCHLVDNACKFSPEGGLVTIHLKNNELSDGCVLLVQDQGQGIPLQIREKVFSRFYQISSGEELPQNHGMGLGLYLARAFAQSREGDVRVLDSASGCTIEMILKNKKYQND